MTIVRRITGPPGTGKTSFIAHQVEACVERWGPRGVMVASLTNAAAKEAAGRVTAIDPRQIKTLHGHAFAALDHPNMAVDAKATAAWNAVAPSGWWLTASKSATDEPPNKTPGDAVKARYDLLRARMIDHDLWPESVRAFAAAYEAWKAAADVLDYTDLIALAIKLTICAPGMPNVLLIDEAQDCSALEVALVRLWGEMAEEVFFVGDLDQAIFDWRGGDPETLVSADIAPENHRVLHQSWRVPRAVHALSQAWIDTLPGREHIEYLPRDAEGSVTRLPYSWREPWSVLDALDLDEQGPDTMIIASCGYMLTPLLAELRRRAIPFWNPYAPDRGQWNPTRASTERSTSSVDRVLAFLRPDDSVWGADARMWTWNDVRAWASVLCSDGTLRRGAKKLLTDLDSDTLHCEATLSDLADKILADDHAMAAAFAGDLSWFESALLVAKAKGLAYPLAVARRHGAAALRVRPRVIVGTVHSVKGGEASRVVVFPDASPQAWQGWTAQEYGPLTRLFYVAATRAFDDLVICRGATPMAVPL